MEKIVNNIKKELGPSKDYIFKEIIISKIKIYFRSVFFILQKNRLVSFLPNQKL